MKNKNSWKNSLIKIFGGTFLREIMLRLHVRLWLNLPKHQTLDLVLMKLHYPLWIKSRSSQSTFSQLSPKWSMTSLPFHLRYPYLLSSWKQCNETTFETKVQWKLQNSLWHARVAILAASDITALLWFSILTLHRLFSHSRLATRARRFLSLFFFWLHVTSLSEFHLQFWQSCFFTVVLLFTPSGSNPRTALLLRTEMRIFKDDKMSPLFQEVIVTSSIAKFNWNKYQMKDMDIIFPLIPHESVWIC